MYKWGGTSWTLIGSENTQNSDHESDVLEGYPFKPFEGKTIDDYGLSVSSLGGTVGINYDGTIVAASNPASRNSVHIVKYNLVDSSHV